MVVDIRHLFIYLDMCLLVNKGFRVWRIGECFPVDVGTERILVNESGVN